LEKIYNPGTLPGIETTIPQLSSPGPSPYTDYKIPSPYIGAGTEISSPCSLSCNRSILSSRASPL